MPLISRNDSFNPKYCCGLVRTGVKYKFCSIVILIIVCCFTIFLVPINICAFIYAFYYNNYSSLLGSVLLLVPTVCCCCTCLTLACCPEVDSDGYVW